MRDDLDVLSLKKRLQERLAEILAGQSVRAGEGSVELDQTRVGRLSRMDAMQQQAMSQAAAHLADLELQRIEAAFKRIDAEEYGYCLLCDEPISVGRLQFDPSVFTCISCARKAETGHR